MKKRIYYQSLIRFMRLSLIQFMAIVAALGNVYATEGNAQPALDKKVTLNVRNQAMEHVLREIEERTDVRFVFSRSLIRADRKISIRAKNQALHKVLDELLVPLHLKYRVSENLVIISRTDRKDEELLNSVTSDLTQGVAPPSANIEITGRVVDETGEALPGVSIIVKGTQTGTASTADGHFSLAVSDEKVVLVFSYVGYVSQEVVVAGKTKLEVTLVVDEKALDEVVVVGYGTQKKVNLTGAVDQVSAKQLETKSVANIGQALQGVVPNLNITFSDGNPVKDPSFNIRGGTSFAGGSFASGSPLILVDGIPMEINNLNPTDIESISVLKDAASAAIYGARAAYGVILVTTKKGQKNSAPKVSFSSSYQTQQPVNRPTLLNSVEYQEAIINSQVLEGGAASSDDLYKLEQVKRYFENPTTAPSYFVSPGGTNIWVANVDPWGEFLKNSAPLKTFDLSISGGSEKSNYYASAGHRNQEGLVALGDDWRKIYNATLGFSTEVNKWLSLDSKIIYTRSDAKRPHGQGGYSAYSDNYFEFLSRIGWRNLMSPRFTPEDSPVGVMPTHSSLNAFLNDGNVSSENSNLFTRVEATVRLLEGLSFKTNFAYKTINENQKMHLPLVWRVEGSWTPFVEGFSTISKTFSKSDHTVYNAYFDFFKTIGQKHEVSAIAGFNQELYQFRNLTAQGNDLATDAVPALKLVTGARNFSDNESHWAIRGAFLRFNYIFNDRYLFEVNGRYDGTSKFPQGSRYRLFPSVSAGWRISEENFMSNFSSIISDLKLRASFGSLGNQDVANYAYIANFGLTPEVAYLMDGVRPIGITAPGLVSPDLTWETATTIDFGADLRLLKKLNITYDWYKRTTSNILTSAEQLPSVLGTGVPNRNSGILETRGWELSAKWLDKLSNGLSYDFSFVLSDSQSEVVRYDGNPQRIFSTLYEGKMMGEIWGLRTSGIFQSYDEIADAPTQSQISGAVWRPGDIRYEDLDGDGRITNGAATVDNPGDRAIIGNSIPRFQFGLNTNVSWRNVDFNMFWQGTGKRDYWSGSYLYWGLIRGTNIHGGIGTPEVYYDSWTPERTDAFFPAYKPALKNMEVQSRYLQNAAFMRLRNITLGYSLPRSLTKKINIEKVRIYSAGFNLVTLSNVPKFMDPENMDDAYPLMRSFTMGLQINF